MRANPFGPMRTDPRIPVKALLLVAGVLAGSAVFVVVLSLMEHASQQRQAARIEQWGQQLARQDQWLHQVRTELAELVRAQIERSQPPRAQPPPQPALVLKEQEAYLLQEGCLRKILTPTDLSGVASVVLALKPLSGQPDSTNSLVVPRRQIQAFIFSWPAKQLLGMETFTDRPPSPSEANTTPGPSPLDTVSVRDPELWRHLRLLSAERTAEAELHHWLTNRASPEPKAQSAKP